MYFAFFFFNFYFPYRMPKSPTPIAFVCSELTAFLRSQQDPGKENFPLQVKLGIESLAR